MLFHTWVFMVFFLITYPVYLLLRPTKLALPWLFITSYVFYGWWNPLYVLLLVYATGIDFFSVVLMDGSRYRKFWLWVSLLNNIVLLAFFKYATFLTDNLNAMLLLAGTSCQFPMPDILLPVGISFHTFQSISYVIDFYRGNIPRERSFLRVATFVSFFPQLMAGPIERAAELLPQMQRPPRIKWRQVTDGLSLFFSGLFKKLVISNFLAVYVDKIYAAPGQFESGALVMATFAYAWQIYCDFSGYTDMARGLARMMGYEFMLNFNHPYLATGLGDFWSRWHISLSTWFRDYLYVPLGGNRRGTLTTYRNMAITMLVAGLWHGASWSFVIWGGLHALGRIVTRELERSVFYRDRVPKLAKQLMIFVFVLFTWIFFRGQSLADVWLMISRIFSTPWGNPQFPVLGLAMILGLWGYEFLSESRVRYLLELPVVRVALMTVMIVTMIFFTSSGEQPFIYFQF